MAKEKNLFTSESVSEGHPDKVCDQIADAILDACLKVDPLSRVACEVFVTKNHVVIGGEITSKAKVNYDAIARNVIRKIGYTKDAYGFNADTVNIDVLVQTQSPDIAQGVDKGGAGDQGIMFGYATNETEGFMPLPISIAHKLVRVATNLRKRGIFKNARPDMKSQVTIDYSNPQKPIIRTVLMSIQHDPDYNEKEFRDFIENSIMIPVIKSFGHDEKFRVLINPTGTFEIGGPAGDTGVTGRKIIVDTYGGASRHGGGAFSGKDPTKVDRSAAYMARYIAKNLVAAGAADRLEIQLGYAIGEVEPVSLGVSTFGTAHYSDSKILEAINKTFDVTPRGIVKTLSLQNPPFNYEDLAAYGHFGRPDLNLPWERLDKVIEIKKILTD